MEKREALAILFDFIKGRHTLGQMINISKYTIFHKFNKKFRVCWKPIMLAVFPTYNCTMHCDMCLTHSTKFANAYGQKPSKDMDIAFFDKILDRYDNALFIFILGNGEALLNKHFFEMMEHASKKKMITYAGSNGLLVGDYIHELANSSISSFDISINGHNSSEFNRMTGMPPELFDKIIDNSSRLIHAKNLAKNKKMKIIASFILDSVNYKNTIDMIYFADKIGFDKILFFNFLSTPEKGFSAEERSLFADDPGIISVFNQVNSLPKKIKDKVRLPPLLERNMDTNKFCDVWSWNLSIDGDGNVGGCSCQILDLTISGVFSDNDVWNSEFFQEMRRRFAKGSDLPILEPCKHCYNNVRRK